MKRHNAERTAVGSWEWPGASEGVAMLIVALVLLSSALGLLVRALHPRAALRRVARAAGRLPSGLPVPAEAVQDAARR